MMVSKQLIFNYFQCLLDKGCFTVESFLYYNRIPPKNISIYFHMLFSAISVGISLFLFNGDILSPFLYKFENPRYS